MVELSPEVGQVSSAVWLPVFSQCVLLSVAYMAFVAGFPLCPYVAKACPISFP